MPGRRISPSGQTQKKDRRPGRTGAGVAGAEAAGEGSGGDGSKSLGVEKKMTIVTRRGLHDWLPALQRTKDSCAIERYDPLI